MITEKNKEEKLSQKMIIFGLLCYTIGFIILINGLEFIDILGHSLIYAGLFCLGVYISIKLDNKEENQNDN